MCPTGTTTHRHSATNPSLRTAFHVIDADNDGRISQNDLRQFYASARAGPIIPDDVIGSMIQAADFNKDGYVEYDEFETVLEREKGRKKRGGVMEEVFKAMDRDGDGIVGQEDLKGFLISAGLKAHDEDVKAMIRLGCVGGDESKGVSFDGLLKILALSD